MRASSLAIGLTALLPATTMAVPTCRNVTIPVSIAATNVKLPSTLTLQSLVSFLGLALSQIVNIPIKGTYSLFGQYCEPEVVVPAHKDVLHLLVHGSQRDHTYWNGYDFDVLADGSPGTGRPYGGSANYSWVQRASLLGYPTLAIDRLGSGASSHPDPNTVVQLPAQVEAVHAVVDKIKAGGGALLRTAGGRFSEVVYVGHSLGSVLGQLYLATYPADTKRAILTGWTIVTAKTLAMGSGGTNNSQNAKDVYPARFGSLPAGYVVTTNRTFAGLQTYYGYGTASAGQNYDPALPPLGFSGMGTSTNGESYSTVIAVLTPPTAYKGKVFVLTGQHDAFLCGTFNAADCGTGATSQLAQSKTLFPAAKSFDYYAPPNTGHEWNYHYTQDTSFAKVFDWINGTAY